MIFTVNGITEKQPFFSLTFFSWFHQTSPFISVLALTSVCYHEDLYFIILPSPVPPFQQKANSRHLHGLEYLKVSWFHSYNLSLQLYGRRAAWEDPAAWVIDTYPWSATPHPGDWPPLLQLRPEDVGFDGYSAPREGIRKEPAQSDSDADPLVSEAWRKRLWYTDRFSFLLHEAQSKWHLVVPTDEHADASEGGGDIVEPTELRQWLQQQQSPGWHPGLIAGVDLVMPSRRSTGIRFHFFKLFIFK